MTLVAAKVSVDSHDVFFFARTKNNLSSPTDPSWMLLFIDADKDPKTGWLGYDFVVNRKVRDSSRTTLERNIGGKYEWDSPFELSFKTADHAIELAIPRAALGLSALPAAIDFKWADNLRQNGDWSDFTLNGDAAPMTGTTSGQNSKRPDERTAGTSKEPSLRFPPQNPWFNLEDSVAWPSADRPRVGYDGDLVQLTERVWRAEITDESSTRSSDWSRPSVCL